MNSGIAAILLAGFTFSAQSIAQSKAEVEFNNKSIMTAPHAGTVTAVPAAMPLPSEDLKILKDLMKDKVATADKFLDQAETLTYQAYDQGAPITLKDCQTIEAQISKNYPLHMYLDYSDMKEHHGVHICPNVAGEWMGIFDSEWIYPQSVKYLLSSEPVTNLLNVKGTSILTISYRNTNSVDVFRQYILDAKSKIVQFTSTNSDAVTQFYTVISAVNTGGDVLSKSFRNWKTPNAPYSWKRWAGYVSVNGNLSPASKYVQNDGKGIEVEERAYIAPYNWKWEAFELSPYTRTGGIYKVGKDTTSWPNSQSQLKLYSKPGLTCGLGYIGFDKSGNQTRQFGDQDCAAKMDVNTVGF